MKKIIASIIVLSWMSVPVFAQGKKMTHKGKSCPAATCTDHSYDQAYSAPKGSAEWVDVTDESINKNCPAATCTDHSYDKAFSADARNMNYRSSTARNARKIEIPAARPSEIWTPAPTRNRDDAYSMSNYTIYSRQYKDNPDPYNGDDAPSYDGAAKNAYRNMRANNESEPLPANNGK